jgi:hypothetical protein
MTHHPEGFLFSPGQFETCPDWVPAMDTGQQFARIALKTMGDHAFDQRVNRVAKVRNVSSVGRQWNRHFNCVLYGRPQFNTRTCRIASSSTQMRFRAVLRIQRDSFSVPQPSLRELNGFGQRHKSRIAMHPVKRRFGLHIDRFRLTLLKCLLQPRKSLLPLAKPRMADS